MRTFIFVFVISLSILATSIASGGSGAGALFYSYNTSARFEGMGSAGVGAPWGGPTNQWANPAQLAYRQGIHCEWARYGLAEGLADDIVLTNNELIFGYSGITLTWGQWPASGLYLELGDQQATDENGQSKGTFSSYMKSSSYGLALDVVQVIDLIRSRTGNEGLYRYASLSFGYVKKDFEDQLSDDAVIQDPQGGGTATANTHDVGWVARITPLNTLDTDGAIGFLIGVAYGSSTLNGGDEVLVHVDADQSDPLPRAHLTGWSLHGEIAFGREEWSSGSGFMADLYETFNPIISLTYASQENVPGYLWDNDLEDYIYEKDTSQKNTGEGWEVGLANILFFRKGHFTALWGDVDDDTWGWGINLQMKDRFGVRYDGAEVPQARGLPKVTRHTLSLWVDPMAIMAD
jgi:hypothetical protein